MPETVADQESPADFQITRRLTVALVLILTINLGLVGLAVCAPRPPIRAVSVANTTAAASLEARQRLDEIEQPLAEADSPSPTPSRSSQAALEAGPTPNLADDTESQAHAMPDTGEGDAATSPSTVPDNRASESTTAAVEPMADSTAGAERRAPTPEDARAPTPDDVTVVPLPAELPLKHLIVINPPDSGGPVHYAVDDKVVSLLPGEYQEFNDNVERRIRFHRGNDFGDAEHILQAGIHLFAVGEAGWELRPAGDNLARRLLQICRPLP